MFTVILAVPVAGMLYILLIELASYLLGGLYSFIEWMQKSPATA